MGPTVPVPVRRHAECRRTRALARHLPFGRSAKRAIEDAELRILANGGRKSIKAKVARAKRSITWVKAGAVAGALVAATVLLRESRKRRKA